MRKNQQRELPAALHPVQIALELRGERSSATRTAPGNRTNPPPNLFQHHFHPLLMYERFSPNVRGIIQQFIQKTQAVA